MAGTGRGRWTMEGPSRDLNWTGKGIEKRLPRQTIGTLYPFLLHSQPYLYTSSKPNPNTSILSSSNPNPIPELPDVAQGGCGIGSRYAGTVHEAWCREGEGCQGRRHAALCELDRCGVVVQPQDLELCWGFGVEGEGRGVGVGVGVICAVDTE